MNVDWAAHVPELTFLATALITLVVLALVAPGITFLLTRVASPFSFARDLLDRVKPPLHFLIPLIGLQIVWRSAPETFPYAAAINHLITLGIIAVIVWLGLRFIDAGRQVIFKRHPIQVSDNRTARKIHTQTQVLVHTLSFFVILFGIAAMLMTFPGAKQIGASLLASAGLAGLAVGFAAKPVLGNLIAGLQIAITQPLSLDDVVIVENEWGRIEEITSTYVVIKIWDERRLIVPLQYFIENPFQNWTRESTQLLGSLFLWVDYAMPLDPLRIELERLCKQVPNLWDGRVSNIQVTDTSDKAIQLRILVSSSNASNSWDLRCFLREKLVQFIATNHPDYLPQLRTNYYEDQLMSAKESSPAETTNPPAVPESRRPQASDSQSKK
ncbi:MAG: mechanosensitive ion channel [Cellvibrio sp.]|uniref:mechanosensitive ion channel family protein n=1 Tax=Cellvibrio sp. TaxID=1965322 RepID=UPI00272800B8|nr:mechanosensitive ion channel [Cellvibrio sp.]